MPVVPNNGKLLIELDSEAAVAQLVDVAASLDRAEVVNWGTTASRIASDIADHLLYLSATNPQWFSPYRDLAATTLAPAMPMDIGTAAVLLTGLAASSVDHLCERLDENPKDWNAVALLAASADPRGLEHLAHVTRKAGATEWPNVMGVHVGPSGPAVLRFSTSRYAIEVPSEDAASADALVGLPVLEVADRYEPITWHYLSLRPAAVVGVPPWPHEFVHIVAPRAYWYSVVCSVLADGRYAEAIVDIEDETFEVDLREIEEHPPPQTTAALHPYDEQLVYRNGHVHLTPSVVGDAGGPPVGIYPNPICTSCGVLMFHVATVRSDVREYGEGFRSVFICETCTRAAVTGTNWN